MVHLIEKFRAWRTRRRIERELSLLEMRVIRLRRAKVVRMPPQGQFLNEQRRHPDYPGRYL